MKIKTANRSVGIIVLFLTTFLFAARANDIDRDAGTEQILKDAGTVQSDDSDITKTSRDIDIKKALESVDIEKASLIDGRYEQILDSKLGNLKITFTVDAHLQSFSKKLLKKYQVPAGAIVILNSKTGRVMTMASVRHKKDASPASCVATEASPPAASVFKIITLAALLEKGGKKLISRMCYHGGGSRLTMDNLIDSKKYDTACNSLEAALGRSINSIFAKMSDKYLNGSILSDYAKRFGFNQKISFDMPLSVSKATVPQKRLERARMSAGFWNSHLSPVHAAVIAQSIAQKGAMLKPYIVEKIEDIKGKNIIYESEPKFIGKTVSEKTSLKILEAMKYTLEKGTARKAFKNKRGVKLIPNVSIAGKTGTLMGKKPYRAYSWFVGIAPADNPQIAISVLIVNDAKWRIKANSAAMMVLREYFNKRGSK